MYNDWDECIMNLLRTCRFVSTRFSSTVAWPNIRLRSNATCLKSSSSIRWFKWYQCRIPMNVNPIAAGIFHPFRMFVEWSRWRWPWIEETFSRGGGSGYHTCSANHRNQHSRSNKLHSTYLNKAFRSYRTLVARHLYHIKGTMSQGIPECSRFTFLGGALIGAFYCLRVSDALV